MLTRAFCLAVLLAAVSHADFDTNAPLTKPALREGLGYLKDGLMNSIGSVPHTVTPYGNGWIPSDCKNLAEGSHFDAADIEAWKVQYSDCASEWHLCRHKNAQAPLANLTDMFGRVPAKARSWVRHVISLPAQGAHAFNTNGNIAIFQNIDHDLTTFIHETSHSLDGLGAYTQQDHVAENSNQNWLDNYALDPNVPDNYAKSNMHENVAQISVVAAYNLNVPGGIKVVEPEADKLFHQYATIETAQRNAGNLLVAGGACGKRLQNSEAVQVGKGSRVMRARDLSEKPDVSLAEGLEVIPGKEFSTKDSCGL